MYLLEVVAGFVAFFVVFFPPPLEVHFVFLYLPFTFGGVIAGSSLILYLLFFLLSSASCSISICSKSITSAAKKN
jgi:hypothetical protein